jgi:hypothetical protein
MTKMMPAKTKPRISVRTDIQYSAVPGVKTKIMTAETATIIKAMRNAIRPSWGLIKLFPFRVPPRDRRLRGHLQ